MAKLKIVKPFTAAQFTATKFDTAEEKALRANNLAVFVQKGMPESAWNNKIYHTLSQHMYGHIAHYNAGGFWNTWFSDDVQKVNWIKYALRDSGPIWGQAEHTWSDVEKAFRAWLGSPESREMVEGFVRRHVEALRLSSEVMARQAEHYLSKNPDEEVQRQLDALKTSWH